MRKTLWLIVTILTCSIGDLYGQRIELILVPFEEDGKWGYVNYNDSIIVKPIYEEAFPTYDLRGRIKLNGKYGFIDENGQILISPKYDKAEDFRHGIAKVLRKEKTMYIRTDGKENRQSIDLCGAIYRECLEPGNFVGIDTTPVNDKYQIQINKIVRVNGKLDYYPDTLETLFDNVTTIGRQYIILVQGEKKAILFDQRGYPSSEYIDTTLNFKYEDFKFFACQENESKSHEIFGFKENNKWGYIQLFYEPNEIIEAKYFSISSMEKGLALVEYDKGKFGYINKSGKEYFKRK